MHNNVIISSEKIFLQCHLPCNSIVALLQKFLSCQVQSEKTVLCNVYQVFLLLAVKTHTALRTLQLRGLRLRKYTKFLHCRSTYGHFTLLLVVFLECALFVVYRSYSAECQILPQQGKGQVQRGNDYTIWRTELQKTFWTQNQSKDASTSFTVPLELCTW